MSAVVFYYRRSEFTTDSKITIRSKFSTGGFREWVGVNFVAFSIGKKGNTQTKFLGNLRKVPGQSRDNPAQCRENFVYVFSGSLFFWGQTRLGDRGTVRRKWMEEVLRRTLRAPLASPCYAYFHRSGSKGAFRLPGGTWDRFHTFAWSNLVSIFLALSIVSPHCQAGNSVLSFQYDIAPLLRLSGWPHWARQRLASTVSVRSGQCVILRWAKSGDPNQESLAI